MLTQLYIKNFALIDELDMDFRSGFSVITGETGAGKSIILGALGLVMGQRADVQSFHDWLQSEVEGFVGVMRDYGQLRKSDQRSYTITDGDFRLEVASNKVKGFDERADLAAERLIDYLKRYMKKSEKGADDPMYQMAMTLLERNKAGDLDYKSISKLYELEDKFDSEYSEIMSLFKEANVVQKNAVNYYFSKRNPKTNVWQRIEPSFCRM